jgi:tetratricopeptide (TPR) repeat protein
MLLAQALAASSVVTQTNETNMVQQQVQEEEQASAGLLLLRADQILSDDHHSASFICGCCHRLVHPTTGRVCGTCWQVQCCRGRRQCCTATADEGRPLDGLAVRVLSRLQVACCACDWNGNYGDYWDHMAKAHGSSSSGIGSAGVQAVVVPSSSSVPLQRSILSSKDQNEKAAVDNDQMWNELENLDIRSAGPSNTDDGGDDEDEDEDELKKFNDWNTSINSNMGCWMNDESDDSNSDDDEEDASDSRKDCQAELERLELKVAGKSKSPRETMAQKDDGGDSVVSSIGDTKQKRSKESSRKKDLSTERKRRPSQPSLPAAHNNDNGDLVRGSRSRRDKGKQQENVEKLSAREKIIIKAERYKKQANAKFNKGEYSASRGLYSKGIRTMEALPGNEVSKVDQTLLANMLSNRAVSCFHEKQFDRTIDDCNAAIELQPAVDKPYIRKWRAMMAKGEFYEAYRFVRLVSSQTFPESAKLRQGYKQCHAEREALETVKAFMNKGDIVNAQSTLDSVLANTDCDNIVLFVYSARLRITVGDFQPALEKINKALRFNPDYVDALECRGFLYFFTGEMKKAASFLYDAYTRHKECTNLKSALDRVQATHQLVQSAEVAAKARSAESIELYTRAIQASQPLPPLALLNVQLQTARATQRMEQQQYVDALKDCQAILQIRPKYGPAWAVRSEVMCALGKPEHAYRDLQQQQSSWAKDDGDVQRALKDVEFELRVLREEQTITAFCTELSAGDYRRLLRYPSLVVTTSPSSISKNPRSRKSPSNSSPIRNNSNHKLTAHSGTTPRGAGKGKESLKSSSCDERQARGTSRELKKSSSSRNGLTKNDSTSSFDLRNLTDINESIQNDPNETRRRSRTRESKQRRHESFRELRDTTRRGEGGGSSSNNTDPVEQRRRYRKSNSQSQLKG